MKDNPIAPIRGSADSRLIARIGSLQKRMVDADGERAAIGCDREFTMRPGLSEPYVSVTSISVFFGNAFVLGR